MLPRCTPNHSSKGVHQGLRLRRQDTFTGTGTALSGLAPPSLPQQNGARRCRHCRRQQLKGPLSYGHTPRRRRRCRRRPWRRRREGALAAASAGPQGGPGAATRSWPSLDDSGGSSRLAISCSCVMPCCSCCGRDFRLCCGLGLHEPDALSLACINGGAAQAACSRQMAEPTSSWTCGAEKDEAQERNSKERAGGGGGWWRGAQQHSIRMLHLLPSFWLLLLLLLRVDWPQGQVGVVDECVNRRRRYRGPVRKGKGQVERTMVARLGLGRLVQWCSGCNCTLLSKPYLACVVPCLRRTWSHTPFFSHQKLPYPGVCATCDTGPRGIKRRHTGYV